MKNSRGFTVWELVVAIVLVSGLITVASFLLRPKDTSPQTRDAQRRLDLARIAQAFTKYEADNHTLPPGLPTSWKDLGSSGQEYDLCKYLVPKYLSDIPLDPLAGAKIDGDGVDTKLGCDKDGVTYSSAYAIRRAGNGQLVLSADIHEGAQIFVVH